MLGYNRYQICLQGYARYKHSSLPTKLFKAFATGKNLQPLLWSTSQPTRKYKTYPFYGLFTLVKFVSGTVSDSDMKQYLPWPPWVTQHR